MVDYLWPLLWPLRSGFSSKNDDLCQVILKPQTSVRMMALKKLELEKIHGIQHHLHLWTSNL